MRNGLRWVIGGTMVVVGLFVALLASGVLAGDEEGASTTTTVVSAAVPAPSVANTTPPPPTTTLTSGASAPSGPDALCVLADEMAQAIDGHLPVESPDDLEAVITAQTDFYRAALEVVGPEDQTAFGEFLSYQQDLADYSASWEWTNPPLEVLLENPPPQPPADATLHIRGVLEERCGLVLAED